MYECVQSIGGMIMTGENQSSQRETYPSAIPFNINPTWTSQGTDPWLHGSKWYGIVNDNIANGTNVVLQLNTNCTKLNAVVSQPDDHSQYAVHLETDRAGPVPDDCW